MNKNSIIFSTTLNFFITFILLLLAFAFLFSHENSSFNEQLFDRYKPIIKIINGKKLYFDEDFNKGLSEINYEVFDSKEKIDSILNRLPVKGLSTESIMYLILPTCSVSLTV